VSLRATGRAKQLPYGPMGALSERRGGAAEWRIHERNRSD
jgi:hypothetical protein